MDTVCELGFTSNNIVELTSISNMDTAATNVTTSPEVGYLTQNEVEALRSMVVSKSNLSWHLQSIAFSKLKFKVLFFIGLNQIPPNVLGHVKEAQSWG
jgi:hypothetical protein